MLLQRVFAVLVMALLIFGCNNQPKEDLLRSGVELLGLGNTRGAIVYFKNALDKDPNYLEARYHLADAYLRSGRFVLAENEFRKVFQQNPSFPELSIKLAEVYLQTSQHQLAIQTLEKYHLDTEPSVASLDTLGRAYALTGDLHTAESLFQKAIALEPENPLPNFHLAKTFLAQSRNDEAHEIFQKLVDQNQKFAPAYELLAKLEMSRNKPTLALGILQKLYDLDSSNINALHMQGIIYLDSKDFNNAHQIAEKIAANAPGDYRASQLKGLVAYRQGSFQDAIVSLLQSLKAAPDTLTYYFLGLCHYRLDDLELAISQFNQVLDAQPDFSQARLMLAMVLLQQHRTEDCIREVRYLLNSDPRNGFAYNILGSAQLLQKDYDAAMESFDRAIEINPDLVGVYLKKGRLLFNRGEKELAEKALLEALSLSPDVLNYRFMLASFYLKQENYSAAVDILHEGLTGAPVDALIYNYLAGISFKQQDDPAAVKHLKKAISVNPEYVTPSLNLAKYYLAKAEYDQAITLFNAILKQDSENLKALSGLILVYELTGRPDSAELVYQQILATGSPEAMLFVAQHYAKRERHSEALAILDDALTKAPSFIPFYKLKASVLLKMDQFDDAAETLEQLEKLDAGSGYPELIGLLLRNGQNDKAMQITENVINKNPNLRYGYLLQSSIFQSKGQFDSAAEILERGLSKIPGDPKLTLRLGQVHELNNHTSQAIDLYREIIKNEPNHYEAFFALAALYDRLGDKSQAQIYYQKTVALNDRYVPALNNLAYLYAENNGNKQEALSIALKAYGLAPWQPDVMDTLGLTLLKNNQPAEAAKILEKASKMLNDNPTIKYHLALAFVELEQNDKAIAVLDEALAVGDFPDVEKCRLLLKELKKNKV